MLTPTNLPATLSRPAPRKSHDVAAQLRVLAQTLQPGDRMPSVLELMRQMGVAKTTAEAAVQVLVREGLVVRRRGSGTFVAALPRSVAPAVAANALAVLVRHSDSFYDHCLARLNRLAGERGIVLHCRYIDDALTRTMFCAMPRKPI